MESNLKESTETKLRQEIREFISTRNSLFLSTIDFNGKPFASYAPFAYVESCFYVLVSEIAIHAKNLQLNPYASALVIEDEDTANELFARVRVNYELSASLLEPDTSDWIEGLNALSSRHGDRILNLSKLSDFKMFRLLPKSGRYVKGFGRAYSFNCDPDGKDSILHLREGHVARKSA